MRRLLVGLSIAGLVTGCSGPLTTREKGALAGGAIGAGTGAIIGSQVGHTGPGALIGAGIGAVSGAVIGDAIQGAEQKAAQPVTPAPPPAAAAPPAQVAVAAPPPIVVTGAPRLVWVPQWGLYVMEGYDVVYHDGAYYYFHGGHWWVSQTYTGPWAVVVVPPGTIAKLPRGNLHAHVPARAKGCPPGLANQGRC
jgi:hypothetical protein